MSYLIVIPKTNLHNIDPGSAIVAEPLENEYCLHFEGNRYDAENLRSFEGKLLQAASRKAENYPTIAKMFLPKSQFESDFLVVGTLDFKEAQSALRDRRTSFATQEQCIQFACDWIPEYSQNLQDWINKTILEKPFVTQSYQVAIPKEDEPTVARRIQGFFEKLEEEGKLAFHRKTRRDTITADPNLPEKKFWETPLDEEKARKAEQVALRAAAEAAFTRELEESGEQVEDVEGWEQSGNHLSRIYYVLDSENPEGPSLRRSFSFEPED